MSETNLDREAYRLLGAIGGHIEQWILDDARSTLEGSSPTAGGVVTIQVDDIRNSLQAFLGHGVSDIKNLIGDKSGPKLHALLRAG